MTLCRLRGLASGFRIKGRASAVRATMVAALTAFLFAQVFIAAHNASHGDEDHDGHAPACVLCLAKAGAGEKLAAAAVALGVVSVVFGLAKSPRVCGVRYYAPLVAVRTRGPPLR